MRRPGLKCICPRRHDGNPASDLLRRGGRGAFTQAGQRIETHDPRCLGAAGAQAGQPLPGLFVASLLQPAGAASLMSPLNGSP